MRATTEVDGHVNIRVWSANYVSLRQCLLEALQRSFDR